MTGLDRRDLRPAQPAEAPNGARRQCGEPRPALEGAKP